MPRWRSAIATASLAEGADPPSRRSRTTKSFPAPCILMNSLARMAALYGQPGGQVHATGEFVPPRVHWRLAAANSRKARIGLKLGTCRASGSPLARGRHHGDAGGPSRSLRHMQELIVR